MKGILRVLACLRPAAALSLGACLALWFEAGMADIPGYPNSVEALDSREVSLLPRFCIHTLTFRGKVPGGNNPGEVERLTRQMGPAFNHMHHYCYGLMNINRAMFLARTRQDRQFNFERSIDEFNYVIRNAPADFVMLPEILTKKAESLIKLDRGPEGMVDLSQAIRMKPDYWQAYAAMSDYYKGTGQPAKARESLEKGLSAAPNTKALTQRLADLDAPQSKRKSP